MRFCGSCAPVRPGGTCPSATAPGRPPTNGCGNGLPRHLGPVLAEVVVKDDAVGQVEWTFSIDSSSIRAHQHAAGARKRGCSAAVEALAVDGEHLGRSRGGLTSKIHLAVDGRGLPMSCPPRCRSGRGQPATAAAARRRASRSRRAWAAPFRPLRVLADKAYSHPSTRAALRARGIAFTCPERRDQIAHRKSKGSRGGRPPRFDQAIYAGRNVVERCFNRLKQFRDLATHTPNARPTSEPRSPSPPSSYGSKKIHGTRPSRPMGGRPGAHHVAAGD